MPVGLVRHGDAALGEQVFDVAETEGEAVVEADSVADNRGWEPVAWIVRHIVRHPATVPQVTMPLLRPRRSVNPFADIDEGQR